jgi:hypothetical protein
MFVPPELWGCSCLSVNRSRPSLRYPTITSTQNGAHRKFATNGYVWVHSILQTQPWLPPSLTLVRQLFAFD